MVRPGEAPSPADAVLVTTEANSVQQTPATPPPAGGPGPPPIGVAPAAPTYPTYPPPVYPGYVGGYGPPGAVPGYPYPYSYQPAPAHRVVRETLKRKTWIWVVATTAVVAALIGGLVGAVVGAGSQQTEVQKFFPNQSALVHPQDIQAVLATVEPAVVSITSEAGTSSGSKGGDFVQDAGTGMIITPDGQVLTNNHVVAGSTALTVTLFGQTRALPAHVVGTDPSEDLALVQIEGVSNLPTVTLGDSSQARVGDSVLAIGNALALAGGPSVTQGIVSAENRSLTAQNDSGQTENLTGLLQTDAAINPGNSGGPLVNSQAQVIGMNTAVASSSSGNAPTQNIGFAIPVNSVKPMLAQLRQGGTGGSGTTSPQVTANAAYMGVTVGSVTAALRQQDGLTPTSGALILSVQTGSPAEAAALQVNDVIVSFDGTVIQSPEDLTAAIHPLRPGDQATVGFYRGAKRMQVKVTLGARPSDG